MPQLDEKTVGRVQQGAENADNGDFDALPEGVYRLQLRGVAVKVLDTSREPKLVGSPMWTWEFEIPEGDDNAGRRFWASRILPQDNGYQHADFMLSKFAEPFDALGGSVADNTDDLLGRTCRGFITQEIAEKGKNEGKAVNRLEDLMQDGDVTATSPKDDEDYDF